MVATIGVVSLQQGDKAETLLLGFDQLFRFISRKEIEQAIIFLQAALPEWEQIPVVETQSSATGVLEQILNPSKTDEQSVLDVRLDQIKTMPLSMRWRLTNVLSVITIGELLAAYPRSKLLQQKGIGKTFITKLDSILKSYGVTLAP